MRDLLERHLTLLISKDSIDNNIVARANYFAAATFDMIAEKQTSKDTKMEKLRMAEPYSREAIRTSTKIHGATHEQTLKYKSLLNIIMIQCDLL